MEHFPPRPTNLAWKLLGEVIHPGDLVIDATAGNGHDTRFLADLVGPEGRVLAFDIQQAAIRSAKMNVESAGLGDRVEFFHESHAAMENRAEPGSVAAVMFNLGYLPGEDHELTTTANETLAALDAAARVLNPGGVLSVICYPGHPGGAEEAAEVESWMATRSGSGWRIAKYGSVGTRKPAPFLLLGFFTSSPRRSPYDSPPS